MKYSGIDLHSNNSVIVVSDEADRILCKRRVPNELKTVLALLELHRAELAGVVVEATYNWYWLVDGLQAAGYRVYLANTSAIKQYEGLKHSMMTLMPRILRICCGWALCPRATSAPGKSGRCAIWRASACS